MNKEQHSHHGNYLYSVVGNKINSTKILKSNEHEQSIKATAQQVHTSNNSYNIFLNLKENCFKFIFKILDSDNDNLISAFYLNKKDLPDNINRVLAPIFAELKVDNETLNETEFIKAMQHLFEMLTYDEKHVLLNFSKKTHHPQINEIHYDFKPAIDKNSRLIATKKHNTTINLFNTSTSTFKGINNYQQYSFINNILTTSPNTSTIEDLHNYTFNNFIKRTKSLNL